ncbi:hypothetical protein ACGYK7_07035 [Sulfitobacter sp. 1A15299]
MIHHGSVAYGSFDFENDPPMIRNAYIENSVRNTVHDPEERYAGGKFALLRVAVLRRSAQPRAG